MRLFLLMLMGALLGPLAVESAVLRGVVRDEEGVASGIKVAIPALSRTAVTDAEGRYEIKDLPPGVYAVSVLGDHGRATRTVDLVEGDAQWDVLLAEESVALPAITVTASSWAREVLEAPQAVTVLEGRVLDQNRSQTVVESVAQTPGVNAQTLGGGIAKPVIRGLTSQRSSVVVEGLKDETHQWADEHGPLVDVFGAERIEVLRGPQSLLYGSDALGGVLHVVKKPLPSTEAGDPRLAGRWTVNAFSNNRQTATNLVLEGASGSVGYRADATFRRTGDIRTPTNTRDLVTLEQGGRLANSGAEEINGSGAVGVSGTWGQVSVDASRFDQDVQIHEDPVGEPGATPFQKLNRDAVGVKGLFHSPWFRWQTQWGWQKNQRREFEASDESAPALNLILNTYSGNLMAHHNPLSLGGHAHLSGTWGVDVQTQKNETLAEEVLVPAYTQDNLAAFLEEEIHFGRWRFLGGVRSDRRTMDVKENTAISVPAQTRKYNATTAAGGAVVRLTEVLSLAGHMGRGWRAPVAFELFAQGEHEGTGRFEQGDPNLKPETSLNTDLSMRWASKKGRAEVTVFRNRIKNYIYAFDTGAMDPGDNLLDPGDDLPIFQNTQADATLRGVEISGEIRPLSWLQLEAGLDQVRGTNDETGTPLPRIPAHRVLAGVRVSKETWGGLRHPYFGVKSRWVARQGRVDTLEPSSPKYALWDASMGAEVSVMRHELSVDIGVENITNRAYADHLSLFRDYALNPGRDIWVKLSMPFTLAK